MDEHIFDNYLEVGFKDWNDLSDAGIEKTVKYYKAFFRDILPTDKNANIVDLGCGNGQFLKFLKEDGYKNYYGIDISGQQVDFCKEKITDRVRVADAFEFLSDKKNTFDAIVINDVLEHIPKEKLMLLLGLVRNALKNNGTFMAKVPNMSNPFGLVSRYIDITHEIGFTEFSMIECLGIAGFKDIKIKGVSYPVISLKTAVAKMFEIFLHFTIRILLRIQGYIGPKFLHAVIIGVGTKKEA